MVGLSMPEHRPEALSPERVELLQQARRGARSLAWLAMFLGLAGGMLWMMRSNLNGLGSIVGTALVVLLTAWVIMLFVSRLSRWFADLLLKLFSAEHRALFDQERQEKTRKQG